MPEPVVLPSAAAAAPQESGASAAQLAADLGFDVESPAGEYERIAVTGAEKEHRRLLPWIIVAAVAIVAIVASVFIVQTFRGGGETPPPVVQPTTETPSTTEPTEPTAPEEEPSDPETPETGDAAPEVEVGSTYRMPITQWDVTVEVSNKLGSVYYMLDGERMILQDGALLPKFPSSCSEMREGFGLTRLADGTFEVLRPAERCAEATELYDEVWGLVAAMIPTIEAA
ncbi:hypothetical protein [Leucobacter soli]|uniref:hypothetical protein n=1 Tax=Leucobacter soli TaxID=2812850 RepID=UPI00360F6D29